MPWKQTSRFSLSRHSNRGPTLVAVAIVLATITFASPVSAASHLAGTVGRTRSNWPCEGCQVYVPRTYQSGKPNAILIALHGDEGSSALIAAAWTPAAARANTILFAPQCPTDRGCRLPNGTAGFTNSWWGWLQYSGRYDDGWIAQQVNTIAKTYNLDRSREYLVGWSGGADFLGWYALRHASRFAAVAFVAGGVPYSTACPSRRLAAYFLFGSADFRYLSGQPVVVKNLIARCGDPTKMVVLAGADHAGTAAAITTRNYGVNILRWLLSHRLTPR
jgi:poly(3-hydroxybutyrate) depolymerase